MNFVSFSERENFFLHFKSIFLPEYLEFKKKPLSLQCVFHSIRFKVNKVGCRRAPFFYALISDKNKSLAQLRANDCITDY